MPDRHESEETRLLRGILRELRDIRLEQFLLIEILLGPRPKTYKQPVSGTLTVKGP